ncbi:hypothetical protein tb265_23320 [Gemmatimonadetes bacterium T265]|nr:hypothetical protein tb265_23320 [Gemmatimonadetes bacterium T265]
MRGRVAALALTGVVLAAPARRAVAQAQPAAPPSSETPFWLRARLDSRLDARTRVLVERVIDSARASGVPAEPLVDKALEGASKRAPSEAIVRAVRGLAVDLTTARQFLGAQSLGEELSAGAAALRAGVDTDALRRLRHDRPGQPLVIPLSVLADLIASGVPADNATRSVIALTSKGAADEQLVAFRRDVERDIGIGAPPGVAVALRLDGPLASRNVLDGATRPSGAPPKPKP